MLTPSSTASSGGAAGGVPEPPPAWWFRRQPACSLLLGCINDLVRDGLRASAESALKVLAGALRVPFAVPGGGCAEAALARHIRARAWEERRRGVAGGGLSPLQVGVQALAGWRAGLGSSGLGSSGLGWGLVGWGLVGWGLLGWGLVGWGLVGWGLLGWGLVGRGLVGWGLLGWGLLSCLLGPQGSPWLLQGPRGSIRVSTVSWL